MKTSIIPISLSTLALLFSSVSAEELIKMNFDENNGSIITNTGSLIDGEILSKGRKAPHLVQPGVGGSGYALSFSNEQTGRPSYFQALEIDSTATDHLKQWTLSLWFKSDWTKQNLNNKTSGRTTLFATRTSSPLSAAGIYVGLAGTQSNPQIEIKLGDGVSGNDGFFNFNVSPSAYSGEWTFIAITFDASLPANKLQLWGGSETQQMRGVAGSSKFDDVTGTGVAVDGFISIGDGLVGFSAFSSLNGEIDNIFFSSEALYREEIEALRLSALNGE